MAQLPACKIDDYIDSADGAFSVRDMWHFFGIVTYENKQLLRSHLNRRVNEGVIVKTRRDGVYRKVENKLEPIPWQQADIKNTYPIKLPFKIHEHCIIYPKSVIIIAGEKDAGKTSFIYETVYLNMDDFKIDLFNSETGPEQMKGRFEPLCIPNPAPFDTYARYDNFADVIHPEHLSIIDYLDLDSEVYLVGAEINDIFQKLTTGVAVIAMQKPPGRDLAYGGTYSAKRSALYIALGSRKCKLVHVKTPRKKGVNPINMQWSYSFDEHGYFKNIERYHEPELYR